MHDDEDKPAGMGIRARRCDGFCGGWRDPETFGSSGGFHFNVHSLEPLGGQRIRVRGYWCAGGFDPLEALVVRTDDDRTAPIHVAALDPPPDPWSARARPHLRTLIVESPPDLLARGACITTRRRTRAPVRQ